MRKIERADAFRIISEPGDMTRYDFIIIPITDSYYKIAPYRSTFAFPKEFDYHQIQHIGYLEDAIKFMEDHKDHENFKNVNPNTLLECVRSIRLIRSDHDNTSIFIN